MFLETNSNDYYSGEENSLFFYIIALFYWGQAFVYITLPYMLLRCAVIYHWVILEGSERWADDDDAKFSTSNDDDDIEWYFCCQM